MEIGFRSNNAIGAKRRLFCIPPTKSWFWKGSPRSAWLKKVRFDLKLEKEIAKIDARWCYQKSGIYEYVLTRNEKFLNIRAFTPNQKREAYERQKGICVKCDEHFEIEEMETDHIKPWHKGGKTIAENCQMLYKEDNQTKFGK